MPRILFSLLLAIHGLIHLIGFSKAARLAGLNEQTHKNIEQANEAMPASIGLFWLFVAILFIISAVIFSMKKDWWWIIAAAAVLLSQTLIIVYWSDAKYGTIPNVIIALVIIAGYGSWSFNRVAKNEINSVMPTAIDQQEIVTESMMADLPAIVQKWLKRSGIIGKEITQTVALKQTGTMRTSPTGKWMEVTAVQYFTIPDPAFIWIADVNAGPLMHLAGKDKFEKGKGSMVIKLFSLATVTDAKGGKIDQGAMLRFLAEICWFPSAAFSKYITWEANDPLSAKATMNDGNLAVSGIFKFTSEGDLQSFEAKRYYDRKTGATLESWLVSMEPDGYETFEGIRVPARSSVTWKLEDGDFTWYHLTISDLQYNVTRKA